MDVWNLTVRKTWLKAHSEDPIKWTLGILQYGIFTTQKKCNDNANNKIDT